MKVQPGGRRNSGSIIRDGDRVIRPRAATSDVVQDLLAHLEEVGFDGVPRSLGHNADSDVLTWVDGDTFEVDPPEWLHQPPTLGRVAQLIRRFHEASATWTGARWTPLCVPPTILDGATVCHGDLGFGNVVFRAGLPVALIDLEFAVRADRLYDVATLATVWTTMPEVSPHDVNGRRAFDRAVRAVADGYGLGVEDRYRLPQAMTAVEQGAVTFMQGLIDQDDPVATAGQFSTVVPRRRERVQWLRAVEPLLLEPLLAETDHP